MYQDIIETIREPLLVLDQNLRVVTVSSSFYAFFKVKPEETIGKLIYDLGNKQWDIPRLRELLEDILPGKTTFDNYEVEHDFTSIGKRTMLLNARQIERGIGERRIILLAIEDITERRHLSNLLEESETRYRRIFETATDGILLLEKDSGHIVHANPAAVHMLGYSEAEYSGKMLDEIGVPINMDNFQAILHSLNDNGILNYDNVLIKSKSGNEIQADVYLVDRAKLAQCNIRNITEHKKLEAQLRQTQKMEAIGTLAGGIAHDFNNILNVIMGYAIMVKETLEVCNPARDDINEVLIAADRAADLTRRLLVFTRKDSFKMIPVDINAVVLGLRKMLARIIRENIEFSINLAEFPMTVMADTSQMEQVLINMAINARDAMQNSGRLTITTGVEEVKNDYSTELTVKKPGMYAFITIADTGCGMDAHTLKKIFEPFFTTKKAGEGTGLGLAISYGIIKQHSGYISVYSEPERGTEFKLYLPLSQEIASIETIEAVSPVQSGTETVLVAEDDPSLRKMTKLMLESYGYSVIMAVNGEDAITKFTENSEQISIVILDMIMPIKSGKEVGEAIRKMSPEMKILFASGYSMDLVKRRELMEADSDFIQKPFTPKSLLLKVREILDR